MNLNSARAAWHDALYTRWDSAGAHVEQLGKLGCSIQKTERTASAHQAAHQALSARIQHAIATLPDHLRAFGDHMYSPMADDDDADNANEAVLVLAYSMGPVMTAKKRERARYVAIAALHRYRRMHQGGQSEGVDPLPTPEDLRKWVLAWHGEKLSSEQWTREWGGFLQCCMDACNDLDKAALAPVSRAIKVMKMAA